MSADAGVQRAIFKSARPLAGPPLFQLRMWYSQIVDDRFVANIRAR